MQKNCFFTFMILKHAQVKVRVAQEQDWEVAAAILQNAITYVLQEKF